VTLQGSPDVGRYYADVPNRLVGYLVDIVFLTILSFVGAVIISVLFGPVVTIDLSTDPRVSLDQGLALLNGALGTVVSAVYFIGTWRRLRGSPGHRLLRMRIGAEADGGVVTYRQGVVRWLLIGLPLCLEASLTPVISGSADALLILALLAWYVVLLVGTARNPEKQGLHDRLAHTVVTKVGRVVPWAGEPDLERGAVVR
jgi:RDD family protein